VKEEVPVSGSVREWVLVKESAPVSGLVQEPESVPALGSVRE
jgi:hypothetical protein